MHAIGSKTHCDSSAQHNTLHVVLCVVKMILEHLTYDMYHTCVIQYITIII